MSPPVPAPPEPRGRFAFAVDAACPATGARTGVLVTPHGAARTPAFMPVGTHAAVKGVDPDALRATGAGIVLCNTYHLAIRPGEAVVSALGGLHRFMGWPGPILTDSGGFQVFSLAALTSVDDDGVSFRSHLDGAPVRLTPERAMEIQLALGADILMVFDECLAHDAPREAVAASVERRTLPWAGRCLGLHPRDGRALFGIVQGGLFEDLRAGHARRLAGMDFDGFALGGLSVGETAEQFRRMVEATTHLLPAGKPRYLMGVGSLPEMLDAIALGVDMFDCVLPTRNARNGQAFTADGPVQIRNARFAADPLPLEPSCPCPACSRAFSRGYLRHLFQVKEMLGCTLLSLHNLTFMQRLMTDVRAAIASGGYPSFRDETVRRWTGAEAPE